MKNLNPAKKNYQPLRNAFSKAVKSLVALVNLFFFALPSNGAILDGASKLVAFGDSTTSTVWHGEYRFTNDLVWLEYLGQSLNTPIANYSYPGENTIDDGSIFSVFTHISQYFSDNGSAADPNAVHILFVGGNDRNLGLTPLETKVNNMHAMEDLIDHGANKIVLVNLRNQWAYTDAEKQLYIPNGVTVYDIGPFMNNLAAYGITNFTTPCQNTPEQCDVSLLWDATGHPASGWHKAFAQDLQLKLSSASTVPVPAAAWLFGSALLGLRVTRKSRVPAIESGNSADRFK